MVSVEDIATVPIFGSLDPGQLATIANWFDAEHVGEGVRLVGEGSHGYSFFVLAEGTAAVTAEGEEIADRITLAMSKRVGEAPPGEPERVRIAPSRSGS